MSLIQRPSASGTETTDTRGPSCPWRSQSQKYHLENPYWKTFDPYVIPLLEKPMDLRRFEELDTSKDVVVPA